MNRSRRVCLSLCLGGGAGTQAMRVCLSPLHQGSGADLWECSNKGLQPYALWRELPHSAHRFWACHSGLEFEEKGSIPGRASGIREDFWTNRAPAVVSPQECRCLGLRGVGRSPP